MGSAETVYPRLKITKRKEILMMFFMITTGLGAKAEARKYYIKLSENKKGAPAGAPFFHRFPS
jgi:hypothetical protein